MKSTGVPLDYKCSKTVNETAHQLPNAIVCRPSGKWDRNIRMVWMCVTTHNLYSKRFTLAVMYVRVGNSKSSTLNSWTVILVVRRAVFYRHFYSPFTLFLIHLFDKLWWRFFEVCRIDMAILLFSLIKRPFYFIPIFWTRPEFCWAMCIS